jgi:hypothetical protein
MARKRNLVVVTSVIVTYVVGAALVGACILLVPIISSRRYDRYKFACEGINPGSSLDDARTPIEDAGGKWIARFVKPDGEEHQWLRVRFSFKHQNCAVTVDKNERVLRVRYSDAWDLL